MTGAEFSATLAGLGWSRRELARLLGRPARTVQGWGTERRPVPAEVADWLRQADAWLAANPPPGASMAPTAGGRTGAGGGGPA